MMVRFTYKMPNSAGRFFVVQSVISEKDEEAFREMIEKNRYILLQVDYLVS